MTEAVVESRMVTITGTGGVGKTSLAQYVLGRLESRTVVAMLAPLRGPELDEQLAGAAGHASFAQLSEYRLWPPDAGAVARGAGRWADALRHFAEGTEAAWRQDNPAMAIEIDMHSGMALARAGDIDGTIAHLERLERVSAPYPVSRTWVALF